MARWGYKWRQKSGHYKENTNVQVAIWTIKQKKKESLLVLKCCFLQLPPQAIYGYRQELFVMAPPDKMYHFYIIICRS